MKRMLDLCSGLGGASQAFVDSSEWEVLRIENNPLLSHVSNTKLISIFEFEDWIDDCQSSGVVLPQIEFLWASPPCTEFSLAYSAPRSVFERENPNLRFEPNTDILHCVVRIISKLKPKYWCIENVRGSAEFFNPIIGQVTRQVLGAYLLWGNYPYIQPGELEPKSSKEVSSADPLRANYRGKVPIELSKAMMDGIENQKSIFEY